MHPNVHRYRQAKYVSFPLLAAVFDFPEHLHSTGRAYSIHSDRANNPRFFIEYDNESF